MELRKDPITRSWVITGDEHVDAAHDYGCPFCPEGGQHLQVVSFVPSANGNPWAARAVVHPRPIYRIEGEPERAGNGLYDKMQAVGAHEVIVENTRHDRHLWNADDREIEEYLALLGSRIDDLKKDLRFKYVTVFKNFGGLSGQQWDHPTTEIVATTFVPRRVLYELRAAREHYRLKERCVFCDILAQEQQQKVRVIEVRGDYMASCPYAPRVPYETWVAPRICTRPTSNAPRRNRAHCAIWPQCYAVRSIASALLPTDFTWCCTPRRTRCIGRRRWVSGRRLKTITTGTSRSCRFSARKRSRTPSRKSIRPR